MESALRDKFLFWVHTVQTQIGVCILVFSQLFIAQGKERKIKLTQFQCFTMKRDGERKN